MWTASKRRRLERFAADDRPERRAIAAAHPRIGESLLRELLTDEDPRVRRAAVKNVTLTDHLLHIALTDADLGIAAYARLLQEENEDAR